ncbi:isoprenoid biosynthesis glyoxalase ElbB [Ferrimonas marina]|uniref:Glyoxalase n=1 Tax=Ferrimonas marina TaxID=299255 RepID=A0A1M5XQN4_9GAMM|nr:isoprenoid biosynthesis glyoxalase ElbB [Ferrimonas marina]SHI01844.1 Enhancing lycopene biosynthesis protein 2 [Ferrimonas marina]
MKKVAVVLSGCGVYDGSEIHESVLTLLALSRAGAQVQCFAPDQPQLHVINHLTGEVEAGASRNVLVESARIARGAIRPLTELAVAEFDALVLPGGFGAAKNLSDFALEGDRCTVLDTLEQVGRDFIAAGKPSGYMCIAPAMLPRIAGEGVMGTIGTDVETAAAFERMGGQHAARSVSEIAVDNERKIVSTPAYMLADSVAEAAEGIDKLVDQLLAWCE